MSNRTSMELKPVLTFAICVPRAKYVSMSNRTSMELKLVFDLVKDFPINCVSMSNRTSMELKRTSENPRAKELFYSAWVSLSNRTNMELKHS